jgi:TolA-binding protein
MKTFLLTLTLLSALFLPGIAADALRPAELAIQGKKFKEAVTLLSTHLGEADSQRKDYATYLKALALFHGKNDRGTITSCDDLLQRYPESSWNRKALFLKSRALVRQKNYEAAEKIYEAEAQRLFSQDRKKGIAKVLVSFGDELSRKPGKDELEAPAPDSRKALELYNRALGLEIGRELQDEVRFKVARCYQHLSDWPNAEKHYQSYLKDFDPKWSGPVGSPERMRGEVRETPLPEGKHWQEARFNLIDVQLTQCGQTVQVIAGLRHQALSVQSDATPHLGKLQTARLNAEDLLALLPEKPEALRSDSHWLLVRTYNLPHPSRNEHDKAIQTARNFLKAHPKHPRATDTSRLIALTYRNSGQTDNAIAAYEEFAKAANFTFVSEDQADPEIKTGHSCQETYDSWTREATFMIGQLRFGQKKYDAAIQQWRKYIASFPNGAHWSQCQSGIINARFQIGVDAVSAKDYGTARSHFTEFLQDHPLDGRSRQILFILGQIQFAQAVAIEEADEVLNEDDAAKVKALYLKAVEEWERLVSKYPNTEESSLALYRIGVLQEEKLDQLDRALLSYQRLNWGTYAAQAQQRFAIMTTHALTARTERSFRTNEVAVIEVTSRNAPKLTFKQYFLNLEAYFRKTHGIGGIDSLDVDLIEPDKTWVVEVDGYEKYKPITQQVKIPFEKGQPGVCIIKVSEEDFETTTLVLRSDIDIITKTSRRELLVYAQNRLTNTPAVGVTIVASDGKEVFGTGKTGKDGVFRKEFFEKLKDSPGVSVFAHSKDGVASNSLSMENLAFSSGLSPRGYIYTEKPTYRPGESVHVRGILREVANGSYVVPKGKTYFIRVMDPKGRMLQETTSGLSPFGAFDSAVTIGSDAALGAYTISVTEKDAKSPPVFNGTFEIQRYKLEKVQLAFEFPTHTYFRGETIKATIKASYYWGAPAAGEMIDYTLPDGRSFSGKTDDEGLLKIEFDPSGFLPGRDLNFTALAKAYNVQTADAVFLAALGFRTEITPSQEVALAGEPVEVSIKTVSADGKPTGKDLTLYVLRREAFKTDKILSAVPWINQARPPAAEVTVEERKITTDPKTGLATTQLTFEKDGHYILRASGQDRFDQVVTSQATLRASGDEDSVKLRFFADSTTGKVGAELPVRLHSRLPEGLALLTFEGEDIISHQVLTLKSGYNTIDFTPDHSHFPNFRIAVATIADRAIHTTSKDFTIERELRISVTPRKGIEAPGDDALVDLVVTDQNGKPIEAALSLGLVNEALYSIYPDKAPPILSFFQSAARRHAEFRVGSTCGFAYHGVTRPVVKSISEEKERLVRREREARQIAELRDSGRYSYFSNQSDENGLRVALPNQVGEAVQLRLDGQLSALNGGQPVDSSSLADIAAQAPAELQRLQARSVNRVSKDQQKESKSEAARPRKEVMSSSRWLAPIITGTDGKAIATLPLPDTTTKWRLTARGCSKTTLVGQATASLVTRKDFFLELKTPTYVQEGDQMQIMAKIHNLTDFEGEVVVSLQAGETKDQVTVTVKKHSVTELFFKDLTIPAAGEIKLQASAKAGAAEDTLLVDLPVRPWGMERSATTGGLASGNTHGTVQLPTNRKYSWRTLELTVSPSIQHALVDFALKAGGRGTSADNLLGAVSALDYAIAHHGEAEDIRVLQEQVRALVSSLTSSQDDNGSWNWRGQADVYQSCRAYWALALAEDAGFPLHPEVLNKAEAALVASFSKLGTKDNDAKTIVLHALSVTGKADFAHLNRIYRERATLSTNALARAAVAMINLERMEFATDLVTLLEAKAKTIENPAGKRPLAWWEGDGHTILQDPNETTAMTLLALAAIHPDSPLAEGAANKLLQNKGCLRFPGPSAIGPAIAALSAYHGKAQDDKADFEITLFVNKEQVATLKSSEIGRSRRIQVPTKLIKDGDNTIRIDKKGPGTFHYAATLTGFSPDLKNPDSWNGHLYFSHEKYYHDNLSYRGMRLKSNSSSPVTQITIGQQIRATSHVRNSWSDARRNYRVRREYLPAGMLLVEGSLTGSFQHHEIGDGVITMFYKPGVSVGHISYNLVAYAPGTYRVLPGSVHDLYKPQRMALGKERVITILPPGEVSGDPYKMNQSEHFELAKRNFDDGNYEAAFPHLKICFEKYRKYSERDTARMLLWIYTMEETFDEKRVVEMFEILRERHPDLTIPFDKILLVGKAYRMIGEFERAWLIYRATIDSSFIKDAAISATLEDQGQFLGSLEYIERIWREYPDTASSIAAYFAISQQLYEKAPKAHELKAEENRRRRLRGEDEKKEDGYDQIGLLTRSLDSLHLFLTFYPEDPLADDAAFSMANAFFAIKDYGTVVKVAEEFQKRYADSEFASSFQYMAALGHFWQRHYDDALASAAPVTDGDSKDRDYARYITAQIHHAQGAPGEAIAWYEKVQDLYPDAKEAIGYFEEEKISLEEVSTFKPGEKVETKISFRNIKEASLQIYKVDLMKLYLREKNLSNITKVHLAGIEPESQLTLQLGEGKDYRDRDMTATLPIKEEGAYLVICRGDNLFTSGMVLITPLKLEIQESPAAGALRVNVRDTTNKGYRANVHVKAIGSSDNEFQSGDTDLRGIFVAEGLNGTATVIARQDGRYAFYRGTNNLGTPPVPNATPAPKGQQMQQLQKKDFLQNLEMGNGRIQQGNIDNWNSIRRGKGGKGVEVQKAY